MNYFIRLMAAATLTTGCIVDLETVGEVPEDGEGMTSSAGPAETGAEGETDAAESTGGAEGPGNTSTDPGDTDGPADTGSGESESEGGNACYVEFDCYGGFNPVDCGSEEPCDRVFYQQPGEGKPEGFEDLDAVSCQLDAIAAGLPGVYRTQVRVAFNAATNYRFEVLPDGAGVIRRIEDEDDKVCDGSERLTSLREPDYITACQAETDEALLLECLLGVADPDGCLPADLDDACG